ncbi:hypothetical protein BJ973_005151 [Actinoplanes tereljensis]|uniref:ATPase AAA-type core domain-containing protein n=1 Tax=Paractinoplanes tereljensis TaxID=571912 RepID=A0A919NPR5_9ACTN|nr:AAA family ATPase [Actinoplanes tereljensis]GIF21402.1 hypothetical protein Ate02nite_41320 [Actinoplanes tereljensis]
MAIRSLVLGNYRSFRDRHEIELAPVTVILGKNNSGKSALTRLPLLLATGFGTRSPAPLDLDRLGADAVDDFRELLFENNTLRPLELGLSVDAPQSFRLNAELTYDDATRQAVVTRLHLNRDRDRGWLDLVSSGLAAAEAATPDIDGIAERPSFGPFHPDHPGEYEIRTEHEAKPRTGEVGFSGLIPHLTVPDLNPGPIRYLGPYREVVGRQHRKPHGDPVGIGNRGQGLPALLAHDRDRGDGELLRLMNRRLAAIVPGWQIDEVPAGPLRSTVLTRAGSKVQVNLADAGSGLAQVLPILAQCALDEMNGETWWTPLQIVEEPELHLHPAAHAELADLYLATARDTGTRFLIETHSETLLLRLRRRIAEVDNDYGPNTVAIYVVEQVDGVSTVRRVGLDDLGNLDESWPEGYFSQDYHEVRALAAAQADRSDRAS